MLLIWWNSPAPAKFPTFCTFHGVLKHLRFYFPHLSGCLGPGPCWCKPRTRLRQKAKLWPKLMNCLSRPSLSIWSRKESKNHQNTKAKNYSGWMQYIDRTQLYLVLVQSVHHNLWWSLNKDVQTLMNWIELNWIVISLIKGVSSVPWFSWFMWRSDQSSCL